MPIDDEPLLPEPANLKFLRRLVTVLTATMIGGLILIISLLVIRLSDTGPTLPDQITLPDGVKPTAYTMGNGWYAVVSEANDILIFDAATGDLKKTIPVD